jgi:DNA-binding transcriptional ArsR family regulator
MTMPNDAKLDALFAALADPTRRAIVARLATGEATVLELAAPFDISLPAISRHLKVLENAGLIRRGRDAQRRPCELRADTLDEITRWAQHTREAWNARFDRLEAHLRKLKSETARHATRATKATKEKKNHGRNQP